jgi:hypothetical protein
MSPTPGTPGRDSSLSRRAPPHVPVLRGLAPRWQRPFVTGAGIVDPAGAGHLGLRAGDIAEAPDGVPVMVLGTSGDRLCVRAGATVVAIQLPPVEAVLFCWTLRARVGGDLAVPPGLRCQIDLSDEAKPISEPMSSPQIL